MHVQLFHHPPEKKATTNYQNKIKWILASSWGELKFYTEINGFRNHTNDISNCIYYTGTCVKMPLAVSITLTEYQPLKDASSHPHFTRQAYKPTIAKKNPPSNRYNFPPIWSTPLSVYRPKTPQQNSLLYFHMENISYTLHWKPCLQIILTLSFYIFVRLFFI